MKWPGDGEITWMSMPSRSMSTRRVATSVSLGKSIWLRSRPMRRVSSLTCALALMSTPPPTTPVALMTSALASGTMQ
jgi:hypothetical protein